MPSKFERARALLAPLLSALRHADSHNSLLHHMNSHDALLYLLCSDGAGGDFVPRRTWLCANFDAGRASASERRLLRAFAEVVARLSASAALSWRDCYAAFWRPVLVTPLACGVCRQSFARTPDPTEYDASTQLLVSAGPRLVLDLSKTTDVGEKLKTLREFLFMDPAEALGEEMARELAEITGSSSSGTRMPRMELGLVLSSRSVTTSELRAFARILEEFAEQEQRKTAGDGVVQFEVTALWLQPDRALSPIDMEILGNMIADESATIRELMFGFAAISLRMIEVEQAFKRFVRRTVCCLEEEKSGVEDSRRGLQTLQLDGAPMAYGHLVSLCSALRYRNSLTELTVEWENDQTCLAHHKTDLMWAWIAYGVFHPDSQARLNNLCLSGWPIRRVDMDAFESILRSPHPGRQLWILEHGGFPHGKGMDEAAMPPGRRVMLDLKAKTKIREFPKQRSTVLYQTASHTPEEFEVAILLESWVCVVVPAFGLGWIPTTSIVSRREVSSKCTVSVAPLAGEEYPKSRHSRAIAAPNVKSFSRFALGDDHHVHEIENDVPFAPDTLDDVKFLIRMIGHGLEGLDYPLHGIDISGADLREILESCPNLRQLNLKGNHLAGISQLVDRYRTQKCQIASLSIDSICEHAPILSELTELLASPSSKPLLSVEVSGLVESYDRLEQLGKALETNKTLELLSVYLDHPDNGGEILARIQDEQQRVIGSKLPMASKTAFLSVIHEHANRASSDPRFASLARMDSSIVAQVFAFAAVPIARSIVW